MSIDLEVISNLNNYIISNNISLPKLAKEANLPYHNLWAILNHYNSIKVGDYVSICRALNEPIDFFIPKK